MLLSDCGGLGVQGGDDGEVLRLGRVEVLEDRGHSAIGSGGGRRGRHGGRGEEGEGREETKDRRESRKNEREGGERMRRVGEYRW